ncbi:DbpA RNA binding domain-containing protein, partial [Cognatishimia sp.]|uniref:DbpA RNA binding domain-containing protein n=1 Tax=Cognatishimia sp. TaxID=2211648 RepID=UPI0035153030|nr:DbpA RNA binding domain-containing protein [Cognatishimia sp.]
KRSAKKAQRILKMAKLDADWGGAPTLEEVSEREDARMMADEGWAAPVNESEQDTVAALTEAFTAEQLAAAYLRLRRTARSAPEELNSFAETKPRRKEDFGPSTWFSVAGGRAADAEVRRLLPMICKAGDLTKEDIGAIRIQQSETFVQVLNSSVDGFLAAIGPDLTIEGSKVTQVEGAPKLERPEQSDRPFKSRGPKRDGGKPFKKPRRDEDLPAKPHRKGDAKKPRDETVWKDLGPKADKAASDKPKSHKKRDNGPSDKRKGPPPPKGKPNSKKNKARAAAAKLAAKGKGKPASKGGEARPKRRG